MEQNNKDSDLKRFGLLVARLEGGALEDTLSEEMRECVREVSDACLDRGGKQKASLTLKLEFVIDQKDKVVEIYTDVQKKLPKAPRGRGGMFYADSDGGLTRENPRQITFEDELEKKRLKEAERAAGVDV